MSRHDDIIANASDGGKSSHLNPAAFFAVLAMHQIVHRAEVLTAVAVRRLLMPQVEATAYMGCEVAFNIFHNHRRAGAHANDLDSVVAT